MAGAEIIASAIGILCLIIFGYVLIGGILITGENAASAQKDYTLQKEEQMRTMFSTSAEYEHAGKTNTLVITIENTGSEIIGDFNHMDIYVNTSTEAPVHHIYTTSPSIAWISWNYTDISPKFVHPGILDPGETMTVEIGGFDKKPPGATVRVITPNGVTNSVPVT